MWSYIHVWWIKIRRDISGARSLSPTPDHIAQHSGASKKSPHNFWLQKQVGMSQWKKLLEPQAVPLKEPTHILTYSDSLPLTSSIWVSATKTPVAYGRN